MIISINKETLTLAHMHTIDMYTTTDSDIFYSIASSYIFDSMDKENTIQKRREREKIKSASETAEQEELQLEKRRAINGKRHEREKHNRNGDS